MAVPVIMPRQGQSVESCIITEWKKNVGDNVAIGDILFAYETDKASFAEEAKAEGTLLARFYEEFDDVPVLLNVAVIGNPGEDYQEFAPASLASSEETQAVEVAIEAPMVDVSAEAPVSINTTMGDSIRGISPRAKNEALRAKVDPNVAIPTGPNGRIIERDIKEAVRLGRVGTGLGGRLMEGDVVNAKDTISSITVPQSTDILACEEVKLSNLRKIIASTMHSSLSTMAQLTHNSSFDASAIKALRGELKVASEKMDLPNITLNDMILFAVSRILKNHPDLNAHLVNGDTLVKFKHVNLGIAVDTPRGLLVPTLFAADTKSLKQISIETKELIKGAQEGSISPDLLVNGSFTISNLGALGIESFTPVINPPQVGLLGVDCIIERVRTVNGQISVYPAMGLSLTYDHRAIDGAPASRFLQELGKALENINALLVG